MEAGQHQCQLQPVLCTSAVSTHGQVVAVLAALWHCVRIWPMNHFKSQNSCLCIVRRSSCIPCCQQQICMYRHTQPCVNSTDYVLAVLSHWYCCAVESNWFWNHLWNWYPTQLSGKSKAPCLNRITQQLVSTHASSSCLAGGTACTRVMALQLHCGAAREMGQAQHVGLWCG
jgi:hypothetical protein